MPLHEYYCQKCDAVFDKIVSMEDRDSIECPDCGNKVKRKEVSLSSFKVYNPFTKDGEGFSSVYYSKQEAKERIRSNAHKYERL